MKPVQCRYERRGARIIGRCESLGLETRPWLGRLDAEEEMVRLVLCALRMHPDDVVFVHGATVEMASA